MSSSRVQKSKSSTVRRRELVLKIESFGASLPDMGRCTPCKNSESVCFVLDGYTKCSSCIRKGVSSCDGAFDASEFDCLTAKRERCAEAARRKGEEVHTLLAQVQASLSLLSQARSEQERLQRQSDQLLEKQRKMLVREAVALEEIDSTEPPPQASATVVVGMDDAQLEAMFELEPGSMADFFGVQVSS